MGRFISRDSLGFSAGDVNFYGYVGQNPINRTDPFGFEWQHGPKWYENWQYNYSNDELKVLEKRVGRVGESMAEVAEISDWIEKNMLLNVIPFIFWTVPIALTDLIPFILSPTDDPVELNFLIKFNTPDTTNHMNNNKKCK